jgi:DNA repair photolyase
MEEFRSFYKRVQGGEGGRCYYPVRLDTYGCGCSHNCKYCYAKSLLDFRKLWHPESPRVADINKIIKKVPKLDTVVRIGGMTDCFQECEIEQKVTLRLLLELKKYGKHHLIVTKSDLIAEDEYIEALDHELSHIQISLSSTDDATATDIENAPPPSKRIEAIEKLASLGFDVSIRLSPYIPEFVSPEKINGIKCNKLLVEFLRVNTWIKRWLDIDYTKYTLLSGGYRHLELEDKIQYMKQFTKPEISVCEDVDEHYLYWKENFNYNKDDCCNLSNVPDSLKG